MSLHKEINFEREICEHLGSNGWLCAVGDAERYDRSRALFPADVVAWVQAANPKAWEVLTKNHGTNATETLLNRLRDQIDQRGTLDVIRHGIDLLGLNQTLKLAEFKPALSINQQILARYAANRLRVVRQLRYSLHHENCLDLVLFLNGVPVATVELKTDFTQSVGDAIDQYRFDRLPQTRGKAAEPLLSFPNGALVHFAISNTEVHMATQLCGSATAFLPFNQGNDGAAGNPTSPSGGHRTGYLWEQVWQRESWLEILGRYLIASRDEKKRISQIIFPRFHQLDVTRKLQVAVLADGLGAAYLVQHSAGSGKTNSIAWTAHFFAELHDAESRKFFDTVLVVSDRNVIDAQLQEALFDFQRQMGVVATIRGTDGSKSEELAEALSGAKKIVVCTMQTFPFALEAVRELAATQGKRFAVIADEAHSSQAGEAAAKLKAVLSPEEIKELRDGGEVNVEDILAAQMTQRADRKHITFVAFTATPKAKTLELFGRRPDPSKPAGPDNLPAPFHVYSMRQAIEEGFILDVLRNYTSYSLAFRLAHNGKDYDEATVERSAAMKGIMGWVRLHPYNIAQKVQVVVEHFRLHVAPLLKGTAKAMVVTSSRLEAVRWRLAIDKYIREHGYEIGTLVAFSGEVIDPESGPDPFSETSRTMNPNLRGRDIREAFKGEDYHILLVANKFQTGFDQPLLCGMYVDKRLAGIQAVQTLSRLNRAYPGKETTYILDFVNQPDEVLTAFKTYHTTAQLTATTDPKIIFNLRSKLDASGCYDEFEVDRVVAVQFNPTAKQGELVAALGPVADRLTKAVGRGEGPTCRRQGDRRRHGAGTCQSRDGRVSPAQAGHGSLCPPVHLPVADLRLRQHRGREAVDILPVPDPAAGVRSGARTDRPVQGRADPPQPEGPRAAGHGLVRWEDAVPGTPRRGRQRSGSGKGEGADGRDHRQGERPVRGRADGPGQARLCQQRHPRQVARIRHAAAASREQYKGAVRELARPEPRNDERDHGRARRPHDHEHAGAELGGGAGRAQGYPAELHRALGVAPPHGSAFVNYSRHGRLAVVVDDPELELELEGSSE